MFIFLFNFQLIIDFDLYICIMPISARLYKHQKLNVKTHLLHLIFCRILASFAGHGQQDVQKIVYYIRVNHRTRRALIDFYEMGDNDFAGEITRIWDALTTPVVPILPKSKEQPP